jgi:hypothetical protein
VYRVTRDHGGDIAKKYWQYRKLAEQGYRFVIDGPCMSSCTFILAYAPSRVCVTERAVLGFHNAYLPIIPGVLNVQVPREITEWMMQQYPPLVRQWVIANGGLGRNMIYLQGEALTDRVPICVRQRR